MSGIREILEDMKDQIKRSIDIGEHEDWASWQNEEGILLSRKEAEEIVEILEKLEANK